MIVKDPGTRVDFAFEWGAAYPEGQALVASEWLATPDEPGGVTIAGQTYELEQAAVTLAGGIAGCGWARRSTMPWSPDWCARRPISAKPLSASG